MAIRVFISSDSIQESQEHKTKPLLIRMLYTTQGISPAARISFPTHHATLYTLVSTFSVLTHPQGMCLSTLNFTILYFVIFLRFPLLCHTSLINMSTWYSLIVGEKSQIPCIRQFFHISYYSPILRVVQ